MKTRYTVIFCAVTVACLVAQSNDGDSRTQLHNSLAMAQQALIIYRQSAPEQEYPIMLEFLHYYRSWYQAVTPPPMSLVEQLSPAALKFIAQLKFIARQFEQAPRGIPGASRLTIQGEQFYQTVIDMVQSQLIDKQLPRVMVIPRMQSRLF